ncbi:Lipopolysaccharide-modifying protein [Penicillium lagena]|uniref:Lipopolysaccharide-modifying protein n=1 Tax=Penicillium lagena TaxID=94218 RepID=UPI00253FBF54|nr:Lipopolysaccharide-modifying protein [Penicillium lagena]KAJ5610510.1 Lipopolysaccharide-modifying protein [Penicillium lagena]
MNDSQGKEKGEEAGSSKRSSPVMDELFFHSSPTSQASTVQDWVNRESNQVRILKRTNGVRRRAKDLIKRLQTLWIDEDEIPEAPPSGQDASQLVRATETDTSSNTRLTSDWKALLVWNHDSIGDLMRLLKLWALHGVPACDMGLFLESMLYQHDEQMHHKLTQLVDANETYAEIARFVMQHYQIRDDDKMPLWLNIDLGDANYRPRDRQREMNNSLIQREKLRERQEASQPKLSTNPKEVGHQPCYHIPAPRPARPIDWPLFLSDLKLSHSLEGNDEDERGEEGSTRRSFDESFIHLSSINPKKTVISKQPRSLAQSMSAELVSPAKTDVEQQQTGKDVPHRGVSSHPETKSAFNGTSTNNDDSKTEAYSSQPHSPRSGQLGTSGADSSASGSQSSPSARNPPRAAVLASAFIEHITDATCEQLSAMDVYEGIDTKGRMFL